MVARAVSQRTRGPRWARGDSGHQAEQAQNPSASPMTRLRLTAASAMRSVLMVAAMTWLRNGAAVAGRPERSS